MGHVIDGIESYSGTTRDLIIALRAAAALGATEFRFKNSSFEVFVKFGEGV